MKIVCIGHSLIAPRQYEFCMELAKQGAEVLAICPEKWYHHEFKLSREERRLKNYNRTYSLTVGNDIYSYVIHAFELINKFKPDIIYSFSEPCSLQSYYNMKWKEHLNCKLAVYSWENIYKVYPHPYGEFEKDVISKADLILVGNNDAYQIMKNKGADESKLKLIPNTGINTDKFKPLNIKKKYMFIYVGRMVKEKGIDLINEALSDKDTILWVGPGKFKSKKGKYVKYVEWDYLPKMYNSAYFLIQASRSTSEWRDQFNYVIGEALSCGVPAISSRSGSIPEQYYTPAVRFFDEGDINDLKEAIRNAYYMLEHNKYEMASKIARRFILRNYSNKLIAEKTLKAFEEVL